MKNLILLLSSFFLLSTVLAQNTDSLRMNSAFQSGEKLVYKVSYSLIEAGIATVTINVKPVGDTYMYHAYAEAVTSGVTEKFAKIRDIYESFIDIPSGLPVKAIRNISENKYLSYKEDLYDRNKNIVVTLENGIKKVPENSMDVLAAFFFARRHIFSQNMKPNDIIVLNTFFDDEVFYIKIKFLQKVKLKTEFGTIDCIKFVPFIDANSPFKSEDELSIWFSDDNNYIPVKIEIDMPVSSVKCELINFSGLKNKFGVTK